MHRRFRTPWLAALLALALALPGWLPLAPISHAMPQAGMVHHDHHAPAPDQQPAVPECCLLSACAPLPASLAAPSLPAPPPPAGSDWVLAAPTLAQGLPVLPALPPPRG